MSFQPQVPIPNLLGPINQGDSFMIVTIIANIPYILDLNSTNTYYWSTDISSFSIFNGFKQFTKDPFNISVQDINGGNLSINTDNQLINTNDNTLFEFNQTIFSSWNFPTIFLSRVKYQLLYNDFIVNILFNNILLPGRNIIILPINWYFGCSNNSNNFNVINDPEQSVVNWFCNVNSNLPICSNTEIITDAWTNITDCNNNIFYNYCPTNTICGDASNLQNTSCKGPCPSIQYNCNLINNNYSCVWNNQVPNQWWKSPYFIGLLIGLFLLLIVAIILIPLLAEKKNNI